MTNYQVSLLDDLLKALIVIQTAEIKQKSGVETRKEAVKNKNMAPAKPPPEERVASDTRKLIARHMAAISAHCLPVNGI